ncbi:MAG: M28 family peptidase [Bacteroidetes bacterium]|nr:M28 family peptidase [Bacteroidota bacterium]
MKTYLLLIALALSAYSLQSFAQTNILSTNALAEQIMLGNYNPSSYEATNIIDNPREIICDLQSRIEPDSLLSYLVELGTFRTRNTSSDTVSATTGIGAARRWIYSKFQEFSALNENRLIPSYLQFDKVICSMGQHRNIFAVLPGSDTSDNSIILIEAHMDSRCESGCDINCIAHGSEDNGSGTVLVMELARVMSKYTFKHTLVFMATMGEEQGLHGADAFAEYALQKGIEIKAVQNNDVIGGIICGTTSSPPSCGGLNEIDSINVRIFSYGINYSEHKALARYIKLQYEEMSLFNATVPMTINIMTAEDRTGRGGDHIPFRQRGFTAVRLTAMNEHGDAKVGPTYTDRQHTPGDSVGVDTNNDGVVDSFYVDFNYLSRNTLINATSVTCLATGPKTPTVTYVHGIHGLEVHISTQTQYKHYRVGVRISPNLEFDKLYTFNDSIYYVIPGLFAGANYYISVASVDQYGVESLFSKETKEQPTINSDSVFIFATTPLDCNSLSIPEPGDNQPVLNIKLLPCVPNPFNHETTFSVIVHQRMKYNSAYILVTDILGRQIDKIDINLNSGKNTITYKYDDGYSGIYYYSLLIDGKIIQTQKMVISNH